MLIKNETAPNIGKIHSLRVSIDYVPQFWKFGVYKSLDVGICKKIDFPVGVQLPEALHASLQRECWMRMLPSLPDSPGNVHGADL
jgi:hypothetical protein